jgi:hypothetical protein
MDFLGRGGALSLILLGSSALLEIVCANITLLSIQL